MNRAILAVLAAACATIAGCGRPEPTADVARVRAGVAAFREGDRARLAELVAAARVADADTDPCSAQGFADSRRAASGALLETLDHDALFSISEDARLVYLARNDIGRLAADLPRPRGCEASRRVRERDLTERRALLEAYDDAAALWRRDLEAKYGGREFDQRVLAANETLRVNRVGGVRLADLSESRNDRIWRRLASGS